jgi:hypothetical protein
VNGVMLLRCYRTLMGDATTNAGLRCTDCRGGAMKTHKDTGQLSIG